MSTSDKMRTLICGARKLGLQLTSQQVDQFQLYYEEIINWNRMINLTAITDYEEVQVKQFLDSLTIIPILDEFGHERELRLVDIGTGAGFPGLALNIMLPQMELILVESVAKKVRFLSHVVDRLGLERVTIANIRAEDLGQKVEYRECFDIATCRAVAQLPTALELALPFCRLGGLFIAQKKGDINEELQRARQAINILGGSLREVKTVDVCDEQRQLVIVNKESPTSSRYPRRPGMPARRPLT